MSRSRPPAGYAGSHRIKVTASGQHKKDPLPPPEAHAEFLGAPTLISDEPESRSMWHDPSKLHGIDPDLISSVRELPEEKPTQALPPWLEQKRKIRPQYIAASVVTALLAVPALLMAGWIAKTNADAGTTSVSSQLPAGTAHIPLTLVVNGKHRPVCITLTGSGHKWTAWASASEC